MMRELVMKNVRRRFRSRGVVVGLLLCALMVVSACGSRSGSAPEGNASSESASPQSKRAERIISLSPSVTEILYGVGAFGRVVAVSDFCTYPPEVKDLPRIGGWQNTNLERVASFRPDLIVMTGAQAPFVKDRLDALGIRTLVVSDRSLDDAFNAITEIGRATGNDAEAEKLLSETRAAIESVRARTRDLPRRRVLCIVDRLPGTLRGMYTATKGSFIEQLITVAGGDSIAPPAAIGFGQIDKEAIVALDPEVIIDMVQGSQGRLSEDPRAVWGELSKVRAVRDGRIYPVREESVLHPSQFVGDTARRFAEIIHPEVFKPN